MNPTKFWHFGHSLRVGTPVDEFLTELEVTVPENDLNFGVFVSQTSEIDFGEGHSVTSLFSVRHTYSQSGVYRVKIKKRSQKLDYTFRFNLNPLYVTSIISVSKDVSDFSGSFYGTGITSIPSGLFDKAGFFESINFDSVFRSCPYLRDVPLGLFDKVNTTSLRAVFMDCPSLESLPFGFFSNLETNSKITDVHCLFFGCTSLKVIPQGFFNNLVNVDIASHIFFGCTSLKVIPEGLFDSFSRVSSFNHVFYGCTSLKVIPEGLFDNNVNVVSFEQCFSNCTSLESIPEGLFDSNINVTSFEQCFSGCTSLKVIPEGLFHNNLDVTLFTSCFSRCSSLVTVPVSLFDMNLRVSSFESVFSFCFSLVNRPKKMPQNWELWELAGKEGYLSEILVTGAFRRCSYLSDYNSLPSYVV